MRKGFLFLLVIAAVILNGCTTGADLFQKACDELTKGSFEKAVEYFQEFAEKNPEHYLSPAALFNAASLYMVNLENLEAARKGYVDIAEEFPASKWAAESYRRLAEIAQTGENHREALNFYRLGLQFAEGEGYSMPQSWVNEMTDGCQQCLDTIDDPQITVDIYRQLTEYSLPGETAAQNQFNYASALKELGREEEAAQEFAQLLYDYPVSEFAHRIMEEERDLIGKFISFPWSVVEQFNQVMSLAQQNNYQEAESILQVILEKHDNNESITANANFGLIVAKTYLSGDFESGLEDLQDYIDEYPQSPALSDARSNMEAWVDILEVLDIINENPQDYASHQQLGFILLRRRIMNLAEEQFMISLQDTTLIDSHMGLGYVYLYTGRVEEALQSFEIYLAHHPEDGYVQNRVGYVYLQINQFDKALECFSKYVEVSPEDPNSHDSYAECLWLMGRIEEAIAEYNKALELDPNWSNGMFMLAEIYHQQGDIEKALEYYQGYLEMEPQGRYSEQAAATIEELTSG